MKLNRNIPAATAVVALLFLLTLGAPRASADLSQTLYCIGGTSTGCSTTAPSSGDYWTVEADISLTASTFDFTLKVTATTGAGGYLQDFSGQYFFGSGASVSNLQWVLNPGGWAGPWASKAGNSGSCQGSANGAFCAAESWNFPHNSGSQGSLVALGTTATIWRLTGDYTGTFLDPNGAWNFQISANTQSDGKGGNAFAISQSIPGTVPDGGTTLVLLGSVLVALETMRRRLRA